MKAIGRLIVVLTAVMTSHTVPVLAQPQPTPTPLDIRVTIDYRNRSALDVLRTLTGASGLTVDVSAGPLLPVSISLTNVRLGTALTAVCENASCAWQLRDRVLTITPLPVAPDASLPRSISIDLADASLRDVFQALAAALNVALEVEGELATTPVTIRFSKAPPENVLNFLAQVGRCAWEFEPGRLTIRRLP